MKHFYDIRIHAGWLFMQYSNWHENRVLKKVNFYREKYPHMSDTDRSRLEMEFWLAIRYFVEEDYHADLESRAIGSGEYHVQRTGREDLRAWYFYGVYYTGIIKWKIEKVLFNSVDG